MVREMAKGEQKHNSFTVLGQWKLLYVSMAVIFYGICFATSFLMKKLHVRRNYVRSENFENRRVIMRLE